MGGMLTAQPQQQMGVPAMGMYPGVMPYGMMPGMHPQVKCSLLKCLGDRTSEVIHVCMCYLLIGSTNIAYARALA
jgi:hypothetical protein